MSKKFYFKQFNFACHLFAISLNIKRVYLTPIRWYPAGSGAMAMKANSAFTKVRLFSEHNPRCRDEVCVFFSPSRLGYLIRYIFTNPSTRAGYDTRSIFKWSLTGFNS